MTTRPIFTCFNILWEGWKKGKSRVEVTQLFRSVALEGQLF